MVSTSDLNCNVFGCRSVVTENEEFFFKRTMPIFFTYLPFHRKHRSFTLVKQFTYFQCIMNKK